MYKYSKLLIKRYFEEQQFVNSNIASYNNFIEKELKEIIKENKEIIPTIVPEGVEEFKIQLDDIWVSRVGEPRAEESGPPGPSVTEADGSRRIIYPMEARLRKLTYASPIFIEVSSHVNDVQRESFVTQLGYMPVMLKSKLCHLYNLTKEELIERGEDPEDPGGYFIINGTEKALISIEDLAANRLLIEESSGNYIGKLFSERGSFKIPHTIEMLKDGIIYLTFTRVKRMPLIVVIKALGLLKDKDIARFISNERECEEVIINLLEFVDIKNEEVALDYMAKKIGITQSKEIRIKRMGEIIDKYLLPHIGIGREHRIMKAYNLCKIVKKYLDVVHGYLGVDDKDHYMNKRLKLAGELLADLFRVNIKVLIGDLLYNFQRIVKRGKYPSIKVIIRDKLLTQRIYSSMATGTWVGGRKGISQRIQRLNFLELLSHLQRVVSPLSTTQENFEARELHCTHLGRLCPIETPEGTNIGLRKNLSLLCSVSEESNEDEIITLLKDLGLKTI